MTLPPTQSDSHYYISVPRRRSSRLQLNQSSASISHIPGSYYESLSPCKQPQTDPQPSKPSKPAEATSHMCVPVKVSTCRDRDRKTSKTGPSDREKLKTTGDMKEAKLQCAYAYHGALMTEGAHAMHIYVGKSDSDFYGKTQALTAAFNGEISIPVLVMETIVSHIANTNDYHWDLLPLLSSANLHTYALVPKFMAYHRENVFKMGVRGFWFPTLLLWSGGTIYAQNFPTQCYFKADVKNQTSPGGPCGVVSSESDYLTCCAVGDTCLQDGICHYTHAMPTNGGTSTGSDYIGGTTDPNLQLNFNTACDDQDLTDIVYSNSTGVWQCCGAQDNIVHCADPTTETFSAPAPWLMTATYSVPNTVVTTNLSGVSTTQTLSSSSSSSSSSLFSSTTEASLSSNIATGKPTPTLPPASSSPTTTTTKSSTLSLADEIGIAVGASIVALCIITSAIYMLQRRVHARPSASSSLPDTPPHAFPWSEKDVRPYRKGGSLYPGGPRARDFAPHDGDIMHASYTGGSSRATYARSSPGFSTGSPRYQGRFLEDLPGTGMPVEAKGGMGTERGMGVVDLEGTARMTSELGVSSRMAGGDELKTQSPKRRAEDRWK
ncbi:hypothetical protein B7494_g3993 [Chlorociboria aeruginascens]|nr:hypothetical protein B7494_g3993 [Chlorociboria aeruginascens]